MDNLATASVMEYEIGLLVSQALDKVGDLVTQNGTRMRIHTTAASTPHSVNIITAHATLHRALAQATIDANSTRSLDSHLQTTGLHLGRRQIQELGSLFSRNPAAFQPVMLQMWYSSNKRPDVSGIVSPPSLLVS